MRSHSLIAVFIADFSRILARRKLTSTHNTPEILTGHKRKVDDNAEDSTSQVPVKRIVIDLVSGASGNVLEEKGDTQNGADASLKK